MATAEERKFVGQVLDLEDEKGNDADATDAQCARIDTALRSYYTFSPVLLEEEVVDEKTEEVITEAVFSKDERSCIDLVREYTREVILQRVQTQEIEVAKKGVKRL